MRKIMAGLVLLLFSFASSLRIRGRAPNTRRLTEYMMAQERRSCLGEKRRPGKHFRPRKQ